MTESTGTPPGPTPAARRRPGKLEMAALLGIHALLSGGFLVAYLSGDEDTYRMHVFAGYTVAAALALRLAAALPAPAGSPLRLPSPSAAAAGRWVRRLLAGAPDARSGRSPLIAWMAAALLAAVAGAALSGIVADGVTAAEHLHEALGEVALWVVFGHLALVALLQWLKRPASAPAAAPPAAGRSHLPSPR